MLRQSYDQTVCLVTTGQGCGDSCSAGNLLAKRSEWPVVAAQAPRQSDECIEIMPKRHFSFAGTSLIIRPPEQPFKPRRLL
jgi:hypothetical protein